MTVRSRILQQIEVDLLRRSILLLEAKRDFADVVGTDPDIPYEVRLAKLRHDLAREQLALDKLNLAGNEIVQLPSPEPLPKATDAGLL